MSDPFAWHRDNYKDAVKFYGYGAPLPLNQILKTLELAMDNAHAIRGEQLIGSPLHWLAGDVKLSLYPGSNMRYWDWDTAIWGMQMTVQDKGMDFEWNFSVFTSRQGEVGHGKVSDETRSRIKSSEG